jgi:endogenous inhibitor of DNA gyrase (YacG/DUF329 family)
MCGTPFETSRSKFLPFCSERCQLLDLGNWLGEAYGMPLDGNEETQWTDAESETDETSNGQH